MDQFPDVSAAEFYHNNSWQQWVVAQTEMEDVVLAGDENILDIGCGSGRLAANLAERVPNGHVVGADISEGMISFAKSRFEKLYANLKFERYSFLEIPYTSEFDKVVSFSAIHWCEDLPTALEMMYRSLKPGGELRFTVPMPSSTATKAVGANMAAISRWKQYFEGHSHPRRRYTLDECRSYLEDKGFSSIKLSEVTHTHYFENKRALVDWFSSFNPALPLIPLELRPDFLVDFARIYTETFKPNNHGEIPHIWGEMHVTARKA